MASFAQHLMRFISVFTCSWLFSWLYNSLFMYSTIDEPLGCSQSIFPIIITLLWAIFYFFFLWLCCGTQDLSSRPGIKFAPSAVEVQNLSRWTAREVPYGPFVHRLLGVSLGVESWVCIYTSSRCWQTLFQSGWTKQCVRVPSSFRVTAFVFSRPANGKCSAGAVTHRKVKVKARNHISVASLVFCTIPTKSHFLGTEFN